jgi:alpha/beta superfamily hydrolase
MTSGGTRLIPLTLHGPAGVLEGLLQEHAGGAAALIAVVCHPHPLYGGTLHSKVVHRTAAVLHALGASVLRFNFRGVGKSEGQYDRGAGELEDARAALEFMRQRHPAARRWLAGFSFGSWIAARLAAEQPDVERLILVAPPVLTSSFEVLRSARVAKLVVQGDADEICPPDALEVEYPSWMEPKRLVRVPGASHFFDKQLGALADALSQALEGPARERTSETT